MSKTNRNSNNICQICESVPAERQWLCKELQVIGFGPRGRQLEAEFLCWESLRFLHEQKDQEVLQGGSVWHQAGALG